MSFPRFPDPARRAKILQAHQLRQQGLTMRQIAHEMDCAVSTVSGYLGDYELFRSDLIRELAADQIVSHLIQLAQPDDPQHDQRLADLRELRLLLTSLPQIRRDEAERAGELAQGGIAVDHYGRRYAKPDRLFPPTAEELEQLSQPADPDPDLDPDQPLALSPEPSRTEPNSAEQDPQDDAPALVAQLPSPPARRGETPQAEGGSPTRTEPNTAEQESASTSVQDGASADSEQHSLDPATQQALNDIERQLRMVLRDRDWLNDYPSHNPWHPERRKALRLVEQKQALLAQARSDSQAPDAA